MYDYLVVGGGVVGTAIFNKLVRLGGKVALIEKQNDVGFGASRANTALIHSGIDCQPGTKKALFNVQGNELYKTIAPRLGVPYKVCGHIIAGNDLEKLNNLLKRAKMNGVKGVKLVEGEKLYNLEPNLNKEVHYGLFIPSGAIIASYELAVAFAEEGIVNGGDVILEFDTKKIIQKKDYYIFISTSGKKISAKQIINAAGEGFNGINKLLNAEVYETEFRRGEYYLLDKSEQGFVFHPVFPLPTEKSKGVLVAPTIHGNILVGPNSKPSSTSAKTTSDGLEEIKNQAFGNFPNVNLNKTIRVFSGIRTICGNDFIVEKSKKVPNLICVAGICSPGLSSAPAIAEYVATLLNLDPNKELKKLKPRPKKIVLNELSVEERNKIIASRPDFGKVVCKCENISLGEIKAAIKGVLPAKSVDAVKRRTRAGMGRCQGGFCIFEVMEEIAKANKTVMADVEKDGVGSKIIVSGIKSKRNKK